MDGYYKMENETNQTIVNGWLHTGDEGYIDDEGFLKITGRVKDLFKTTKGKYVAPSPIEMKISVNKDIEQVCVVGDELPQPIALLVLSENGECISLEDLKISFNRTLKNINSMLENHEKIHNFIVLDQPWTVENKLLTPTMKIKRNLIEKKYSIFYKDWYDKESIFFI